MEKSFSQICYENFNINDDLTLKVLTTINEADQNSVLSSLTNKLYNAIVDKVDDVDFGNIPSSKGDITKIQNYDKLVDCTDLIKQIVVHYNQDPKPVQEVIDAIENIKSREQLFAKCFATGNELGETIYNTMVLSCVSSISFLIATTIEYVRTNESVTFDIALNKVAYVKTKDGLLFKDIAKFNTSCKKGDLDKALEQLVSNKKNFIGGVAAGIGTGVVLTVGLIAIIASIIPFIRELIYYFFVAKQSVSDYFALEADLLDMNASNIEYDNKKSDKDKKKIVEKQKKIAERWRKLSNKFAIKMKQAENETPRELNKDKKKYNIDDVVDTMPDSANTDDSIF